MDHEKRSNSTCFYEAVKLILYMHATCIVSLYKKKQVIPSIYHTKLLRNIKNEFRNKISLAVRIQIACLKFSLSSTKLIYFPNKCKLFSPPPP